MGICWDNLLKETETTRPMTRNKLPVVAFKYLNSSSFNEILRQEYIYIKEQNPNWQTQKILDQTISNCYREQRHWISYKVPKWLDVVNSLQKEICKIKNISNVGDYSYASSQLENEGVDGNYSILLDMGVPASAIKKMVPMLSEALSLKEVVNISKKIANSSNSNLLQYEKEKLRSL